MKTQGEKRPRFKNKKVWAAAGLLVAAVAATYADSFQGPFIFDDVNSIVENGSIRHLWSAQVLAAPPRCITAVGRPVLNVSLAINYALGGLGVRGYHAVNLGIHVLAALTLLGLVRRTLIVVASGPDAMPMRVFAEGSRRDPPAETACGHGTQVGRDSTALALAVALLWSLHPLQTESVTYIVQRAESLVGLFYLLTLYCLVRGAASARGGAWAAAAVAACALGMASKEIMVSAPLMALLYDRTFLSGSFRAALRRRWGLYLGLGATWGILGPLVSLGRGGSSGFGLGMTSWEYARTQFGFIIHYLRLAFWPGGLVLDYGTDTTRAASQIVPYAIAVGLLAAGAAAALVRRPKWGFLGAWFFAILAPTSSIVPLVGQIAAERRMYLPLAAVIALVVLGGYEAIEALARRSAAPACRALAGALVLAAAAALGWGSWQRNHAYRSTQAIWNDTVEKCPYSSRAFNGRGLAYKSEGRYEAAIGDFDKAIELDPGNAEIYNNRGNACTSLGRYDLAIRDYDKAIELLPGYADAYSNRGNAYNSTGRQDAAIRDLDKAIELAPAFAEAYFNRGNSHRALGRPEAAIGDYCKAIDLNPDRAEPYVNRGNAYSGMGRYEAAIKDYDKAIELAPRYADAYQNRAAARFQLKAYDQAWADVKLCRSVGGAPRPELIEALTRATGRSE